MKTVTQQRHRNGQSALLLVTTKRRFGLDWVLHGISDNGSVHRIWRESIESTGLGPVQSWVPMR